jgi:anti-sigma regulatory factor (Ser/Thr protein kinase)
VTAATADSVAELSISADAGEVRRASAWLETTGLQHRVPAEQIHRLELCLNEVLANIIMHGGPAARSSLVRLYFHAVPNQAEVTVTDSGAAFDPLAYRQEPGPQTLTDAEPGGLGLVMMHGFADDISYRYSGGRNQLTFRVFWTEPN